MNKYLGPSSRFGDGDGSFWDRWLTTTGHFTAQGNYAKADMPSRSMYSTGVVRDGRVLHSQLFSLWFKHLAVANACLTLTASKTLR